MRLGVDLRIQLYANLKSCPKLKLSHRIEGVMGKGALNRADLLNNRRNLTMRDYSFFCSIERMKNFHEQPWVHITMCFLVPLSRPQVPHFHSYLVKHDATGTVAWLSLTITSKAPFFFFLDNNALIDDRAASMRE